jgi:enamine deaminase RidA (YjgF/YER057c/UK114 family)
MTDKHVRIKSGAPWEPVFGYCRAVRAGSIIAVSGSASVGEDGKLVGEGDMYEQARQCIRVIAAALEKAGCGLEDVVRTRTYVTDIDQWKQVARAHSAAFGAAPPATTLVEVSRLIDPAMLVEIEADAVIRVDTEG